MVTSLCIFTSLTSHTQTKTNCTYSNVNIGNYVSTFFSKKFHKSYKQAEEILVFAKNLQNR